MADIQLYTYWRSSAAYRVRIALNLKQLAFQSHPVHLVANGGEQKSAKYQSINPQKLVPTLIDGDVCLTQSLAIIEYLDERYPEPALLPKNVEERARVRMLSQVIASDIHPINNLRVLQYLESMNQDKDSRDRWYRHWISEGFDALESMLVNSKYTGPFCHGETPTMADITLIPQMYNARRFDLDLSRYPTLLSIEDACKALDAFRDAAPEHQPDAV